MPIETTVLLVEASALPSSLEEQLSKRSVFSEHASLDQADQVIPVLVPDLILASGKSDITPILECLSTLLPRPALIVIADRATIRRLKEDENPVVSALIPQDLPIAAIAHRVATMARRSAKGEPLEVKTNAGIGTPKPRAKAAAPAAFTPGSAVRRASERPPPKKDDASKESKRGSLAPQPLATSQSVKILDAEKEAEKEEKKAKLAQERTSKLKAEKAEAQAKKDAAQATRAEAAAKREAAQKARADKEKANQDKLTEEKKARLKRESARKADIEKKRAEQAAREKRAAAAREAAEDHDTIVKPSIRPLDDEVSVVAPLPVDVRVALSATREHLRSIRLGLLDTDLTRADRVSAELRRMGMEVLPLTPDLSRTRWPLLRRFAPQGLVVDEKSMVRGAAEWVETFRGDPFLRHVPVVLLRFSRLFRDDEEKVDPEPLLHLVEPLGKEEFELLDKLKPARQVDLRLSQIVPYRLVQMLTEQDRNTRLDCRTEKERIVWPLGPGYAGKAKLLNAGSEKVLKKLSPQDAMSWLLSHDDCAVSVHEHTEPLAHASESADSLTLLQEMTDTMAAPTRHQSIAPAGLAPAAPAHKVEELTAASLKESPGAKDTATPEKTAARAAPPMGPPPPRPQQKPPSAPGLSPSPLDQAKAALARLIEQSKTLTLKAWAAYQRFLQPLRPRIPDPWFNILSVGLPVSLLLVGLLILGRGPDEAAPIVAVQKESQSLPSQEVPLEKEESKTTDTAPANSPDEKAAPQEPSPKESDTPTGSALYRIAPDSDLPSCEKKLGAAAPQETDKGRAIGYWKQARRLLMSGKMDEALEMMCLAGLFDPEGPAAEGLAEYYLAERSLKEAEMWVHLSLKADINRRKSKELLGDIENQMGQVEASRKTWLETMNLTGDETGKLQTISRKLTQDAKLARRGGDLPRAERTLRRAITLTPENPVIAAELADLFLQRKEVPAAEAWAAEARRLDPNFSGAKILSGKIAEILGKNEEAAEFYSSVPPGDAMYKQAQVRLKRLNE